MMKPVSPEQVALLFLTTGALFHERSWALWFSQAADLLPLHCLLQAMNGSTGTPRMAARNSLVVDTKIQYTKLSAIHCTYV